MCFTVKHVHWNLFKSKLLVCNFASSFIKIDMLFVIQKYSNCPTRENRLLALFNHLHRAFECMFWLRNHENDWFLVAVVGAATVTWFIISEFLLSQWNHTFSAYSLEFSDAKIPQGLKWVKHKHAQSNIHECFSEKNSTLLTSSLFDSHCYSGWDPMTSRKMCKRRISNMPLGIFIF